jgi:large subunit ribosomal protein L17
MRHGKKQKKFRREMGNRIALFKNLSMQLFQYGKIRTGLQKAKYLRGVVEPMITRAKVDSVHNRREIARVITEPEILVKLFKEIAPLYKERKGGYTRVLRLEPRPGDNAEMGLIELVGAENLYKKAEPKEGTDKKETKAAKKEAKEVKSEEKKEVKKEAKKEEKKETDKKSKK